MRMYQSKGYSLIEVMIVVAILGIVAAVALPSYRASVLKSNRSDGFAILNEIMQAQERYAAGAGNGSYTTVLTELGYLATPESAERYFRIQATRCNDDPPLTACVRLVAIAQNGQEDDANNITTPADPAGGLTPGDMSLNSRGEKYGWK